MLAELRKGETFFDLGAGDGRSVVMAAQEFGAKAVGIELREDLAKRALSTITELGIEDKAQILQADFFNIDLRTADVVFLYLTTSANEKIKP